ncbi:MAG: hypothetical protein OES46_13975 [Gammaproteobacteria bacterium]|nr:hypothetical protein [Gammaproteobacteria bacterium]
MGAIRWELGSVDGDDGADFARGGAADENAVRRRYSGQDNMKHYLLLPKVFLCFVAMGVLSACTGADLLSMPYAVMEGSRDIDTRGAWGVKTSKNTGSPVTPKKMIWPGRTTKTKVMERLRTPEERSSDDRFFLYRYELQIYKVREKGGIVLERTPVYRPRHARFLIWFDQTDIVKRYHWHECEPTGDRKCHYLNDMCQMIKGLQEEQLIAQYC